MIRVLMLDLGGTLIDADKRVFPHVREALEILRGFETEAFEPLSVCLVSDYYMPTPDRTAEDLFREYVNLLDDLNLREFFEPVERHVTLSTQAGIRKPERRIFEVAIERLGLSANLDECLFITESAEHVAAARLLGIKTLLFDETGGTLAEADFSDWSEAPLLIAQIVNAESMNNLDAALRLRLAVEYDLELIFVGEKSIDGTVYAQVNKSFALPIAADSAEEGGHGSIAVLPVNVEVKMNDKGQIKAVSSEEPGEEALDEAAHYIKTLNENKQVSRGKGPLKPGETHRETVNKKGEKHIRRERFSAIKLN